MNWEYLVESSQLDQLIEESKSKPLLIYKHSTSCSVSRVALDRLERNWNINADLKLYFLDLIRYRTISNEIANRFGDPHESPQVLIIENGQAIYDASHFDINFQDIGSNLKIAG